MRLKSVFISQYKNLRNFELTFDGKNFLDVFVGKNGSGKSNLFEALIEIFRHLDESRSSMTAFPFDYRLTFEINGSETAIKWEENKLTINGRNRRTTTNIDLPENVLIYYSGHNQTVTGLVNRYEAAFRKQIKGAELKDSRRFIGIGSEYKSLLLAVLLLQPEANEARQFICRKLGIQSVGDSVRLVLKRPPFASGRLRELGMNNIDMFDPRSHYWGAAGITRQFIEQLAVCIREDFHHADVYDREKDQYTFNLSTEIFIRNFADQDACKIFRQFDNLKTLGMLEDLSLPLRLTGDVAADVEFFSDGQFQLAYIYAIVELFKDHNCITLLDEPDAFLHPEWQFDFLKQVFEISEAATAKNHVLMSSHSAATIAKASEGQIRMVEIKGNRVITKQASKSEIIQSLSGGAISFSETEARLSIDYVLQNTTGAVVFTEGITDKLILETAWSKLYPGTKRRFEIQNTFGCGFLRTLFRDGDLRNNFPNRKMFALFDFDEAYNEWKGLKKGRDEVTDPYAGLAKRLEYEHHYALLLPVPRVEILKNQTLDNSGKPWPRPFLSIELLFFSDDLIGQCFRKCAMPGNGEIIEFFGDKVAFAKERIPRMPATSFEPLRSTLDFVTSICGACAQR